VRVSGEALELIGEATLLRWQFAAASR
jgi:hypothetical protein